MMSLIALGSQTPTQPFFRPHVGGYAQTQPPPPVAGAAESFCRASTGCCPLRGLGAGPLARAKPRVAVEELRDVDICEP